LSPCGGTIAAYRYVDAFSLLGCARLLPRLPPVPPARRQGQSGHGLAVLRDRPYAVVTFLTTVLLRLPLPSLVLPLPTWGVTGRPALGALFLLAGCAMGPAIRRAERNRPQPRPQPRTAQVHDRT